MKNTFLRYFLAILQPFFLVSYSHAEEKPTYYIYLAGPDVFLGKALEAGKIKKDIIAALSSKHDWPFELEGLYPLDNSIPDFKNNFETGMRIYHANIELMDKAHVIAANMVRFRGPSMDVGTAYEMGYMAGAKKPVFAYYDSEAFYGTKEMPGLLADKVKAYWQVDKDQPGLDKDGLNIENFDMIDNLMMVGAYTDTGFPVSIEFEELVLHIADYFLSQK